jgi:hypothetical protein
MKNDSVKRMLKALLLEIGSIEAPGSKRLLVD